MIEANIDELRVALDGLATQSRNTLRFLNKYDAATSILTLDAGQKTAAMVELSTMATGIATAYNDAANVFTATDPIEEEE